MLRTKCLSLFYPMSTPCKRTLLYLRIRAPGGSDCRKSLLLLKSRDVMRYGWYCSLDLWDKELRYTICNIALTLRRCHSKHILVHCVYSEWSGDLITCSIYQLSAQVWGYLTAFIRIKDFFIHQLIHKWIVLKTITIRTCTSNALRDDGVTVTLKHVGAVLMLILM